MARGGTFGAGVLTRVVGENSQANVPLGWVCLLLSVILYLSDIFVTRFNGINIKLLFLFSDLTKSDWIFKSSFLTVFLILLAFQFSFLRPKSADELKAVAILDVILAAIIVFGGFSLGILLHLGFVGFMWFSLIFRANDRASAYNTLTILLFLDFFFFSVIDYGFTHARVLKDASFLANRLIFPIYSLYLLGYLCVYGRSGLASFLFFLLLVFYILGFVKESDFWHNYQSRLNEKKIDEVKSFQARVAQRINTLWDEAAKSWKARLEYATGDYYEGEVEENENEPLGVYLENIEKAETEFYEDEPVSIWVTLKARTLEKDKNITINVSCMEGDEEESITGEVTPKEMFSVYTREEEDILCRFDARKLKSGLRKANIFAEFNFPTMAYLKTYFIDKARMRAMNREGIDVFEFFGISDTEPIAVYTNGPVKIGMETSTPPIGISPDYDSKPRFGITIENQWEGEIESINDLTIYVPNGIEIDASTCNYPFLEKSSSNKYSNEGFEAYELSDVGKKFEKFENIEDFISIRCLLDIKGENANEILGDTPFATKYFRLTVDYQYKLKKKVDIDIKKAEGFNVYFSEEKPTSGTKNLKCIGEHSKKNLKKAVYEFYVNDAKRYDGDFTCSGKRCERNVPGDIIKRGESIKCVMTATDKEEGEFSGSAVTEIGNSLPSIKVQLPDTASQDKDLICNGTYEDKDGDQPHALDGEAQSVNYEFSEGHFGDGKVKCDIKGDKWECKATAPKEELSVGETIVCKMTPYDGTETGDSGEDSVIISAPASSGGVN